MGQSGWQRYTHQSAHNSRITCKFENYCVQVHSSSWACEFRKKPFQPFHDEGSYLKYRCSFMGIKTFLLQSLLDKLVDALEIPVKRLDDTLNATKDLLQLILTSVGKPDPEKLLWKKHCLFLTI